MNSETIFFPAQNYDLAATLDSGQVFRWRQCGGSWIGVVGKYRARLTQRPDGIFAEIDPVGVQALACPNSSDNGRWLREFLQTDVNLAKILETFPNDGPMNDAVAACRGLRILRQEPWECLATFILSATKQIVQIRQIVARLCECFGERIGCVFSPSPSIPLPQVGEGGPEPEISNLKSQISESGISNFKSQISNLKFRNFRFQISEDLNHSFPSPEKIAALTETDLRNCKIGFRAPNLLAAARQVAEGKLDLQRLRHLSYSEARTELMKLRGVGAKIADCVLLFAYGFDSAFPVDVWVERALRTLYFPRRRVSEKKLLHFAATHFGPHAGYAQQYLFHYVRVRKKLMADG